MPKKCRIVLQVLQRINQKTAEVPLLLPLQYAAHAQARSLIQSFRTVRKQGGPDAAWDFDLHQSGTGPVGITHFEKRYGEVWWSAEHERAVLRYSFKCVRRLAPISIPERHLSAQVPRFCASGETLGITHCLRAWRRECRRHQALNVRHLKLPEKPPLPPCHPSHEP